MARNESTTPGSVFMTGANPADASQIHVWFATTTPPAGAVGRVPPAMGGVRTAAELRRSALRPLVCEYAMAPEKIRVSMRVVTLEGEAFQYDVVIAFLSSCYSSVIGFNCARSVEERTNACCHVEVRRSSSFCKKIVTIS